MRGIIRIALLFGGIKSEQKERWEPLLLCDLRMPRLRHAMTAGSDRRGRRVACPVGKNVDNVFKDEMSKRISPAFAVTEGKVHLALPENCPYNTVAWLKVGFGAIVARFFTALCFVLDDGGWLAG